MASIRDELPDFRFSEVGSLVRALKDSDTVKETHPNDNLEHLGPFRLPDFQRPRVWTLEQNVKLIESMWKGIPIGTYSVNQIQNFEMESETFQKYDSLLLDGQQRIAAILDYMGDKFAVFGNLFSDLSVPDQRHFEQLKFPYRLTHFQEIEDITEYYDTMNFGGVEHAPEQRATLGYSRNRAPAP